MKRFFISFSVCLFCLLSACSGDSSASETISTYSFGEDTIPALEQVMTELPDILQRHPEYLVADEDNGLGVLIPPLVRNLYFRCAFSRKHSG